MEVVKGTKNKKIKGRELTSIVDIFFDNKYTIYVFQGSISENDIIVKYSEEGKKMRTPKHIHWAVDLLLKLQAEKELTRSLIKEIKNEWEECKPLESNDEKTLISLIDNYIEITDVSKYKELDNYGEYDVEFLIVLMTLLMTQEKTNREDAYMFGKVLDSLMVEELDIFAIMSASGFGGRF